MFATEVDEVSTIMTISQMVNVDLYSVERFTSWKIAERSASLKKNNF